MIRATIAGPVGVGELVHQAEQEAPRTTTCRAPWPGRGEELRLPAARDQLAEQRPGQRLAAAEHDADQHAERDERHERLRGQEERGDHDQRPQAMSERRTVRQAPQRPASQPKSSAPPKATNCTSRIRAISWLWPKLQLLGAVEAARGDDGLDAVVEEQVGQQEQHGVAGSCAGRGRCGRAGRRCRRTRPARGASSSLAACAAQAPQPDHRDEREQPPPQAGREQADPHRGLGVDARPGRARVTMTRLMASSRPPPR